LVFVIGFIFNDFDREEFTSRDAYTFDHLAKGTLSQQVNHSVSKEEMINNISLFYNKRKLTDGVGRDQGFHLL
jgi:hypothetical protein